MSRVVAGAATLFALIGAGLVHSRQPVVAQTTARQATVFEVDPF